MKVILGGLGRVEQESVRRGPSAGALALHAGPGKAATARCFWRTCGFRVRARAAPGPPGSAGRGQGPTLPAAPAAMLRSRGIRAVQPSHQQRHRRSFGSPRTC